jgi:hypothetical protein
VVGAAVAEALALLVVETDLIEAEAEADLLVDVLVVVEVVV